MSLDGNATTGINRGDPTPDEIAAICADIRTGWSDREHYRRAGVKPTGSFDMDRLTANSEREREPVAVLTSWAELEKIVERAGLQPWPKLFHNLRASRETELCRHHPLHVVCEWIGNSPTIAAKHYLQVTDGDFEKALQNALQHLPESMGTEGKSEQPDPMILPGNPTYSHQFPPVYTRVVGDEGLEHSADSLEKTHSFERRAVVQSGSLTIAAEVLEQLPAAVRRMLIDLAAGSIDAPDDGIPSAVAR